MSDVKRYEIDVYYNGLQTEEDDDGEWVKYEDVEERIAELEAELEGHKRRIGTLVDLNDRAEARQQRLIELVEEARKLKVVDREWETRAALELDILACWGVPNGER